MDFKFLFFENVIENGKKWTRKIYTLMFLQFPRKIMVITIQILSENGELMNRKMNDFITLWLRDTQNLKFQ